MLDVLSATSNHHQQRRRRGGGVVESKFGPNETIGSEDILLLLFDFDDDNDDDHEGNRIQLRMLRAFQGVQ